jgi:hypothetical protein
MYDARMELRLSSDLVKQIDRARGDVPRAVWVRRAVEQALGGEPSGQAVKRSATPGVEAKKPVGTGATPVSPSSTGRPLPTGAETVERKLGPPASAPEDYEIPKIARRKP